MENKNYIPENIYDVKAVEYLQNLPFETVRQDIPKLLEWLQDAHWDVAGGIAEYLVPHVNEITQELLFVLSTDDGMWKCFLIGILIARSKEKLDPALINELRRIAEHPSKIDTQDGVDDMAKMVIANKILCD